jgi:dCTP deaminase
LTLITKKRNSLGTIESRCCVQVGTLLTLLSDVEIEELIKRGSLVLTPFDPECLNGAGYDLRLATEVIISPGCHELAATLERIELGTDVAGIMHIRSSLARAGIIASLALIDPGFRGQLTISLYNAGTKTFTMNKGDRFVQVTFHRLGMKTTRPYHGRYQDSQGVVER